MFGNMQNGAFNSFDPTLANNSFDPTVTNKFNNASGDAAGYTTQDAKPGQKMQVNLSLANATAANLTFELFSYLDSQLRRQKNEYITGAFTYIPWTSFEG